MSTGLRRRVPRPRRSATVLGMAALVATLAASTALTANKAALDPPAKVRICHATNSESNPYVSEEPAIGNNGDLNGGHLNHTGPVYPADGWGDIIPPYEYLDEKGQTKTFPGYNWSRRRGRRSGRTTATRRRRQLRPVRARARMRRARRTTGSSRISATTTRTRPPSRRTADENFFSPGDTDRGQPKHVRPRAQLETCSRSSRASPSTWSLTGDRVTASEALEPRCEGLDHGLQELVPSDDDGRFDAQDRWRREGRRRCRRQ